MSGAGACGGGSGCKSTAAPEGPCGGATVKYEAKNFTAQGGLAKRGAHLLAKASGSLGSDNLVFGFGASYNLSTHEAQQLDAGLEYSKPNFVLTARTKEKAEKLNVGFHHKMNSRSTVGALMEWPLAYPFGEPKLLTIAGEHTFSPSISVAAKADSRGVVTGSLEHRFDNPTCKVSATAQWDASKKSLTADKFGVQVSFGDI